MPCLCIKCGKPMNDCEFTVCLNCYLGMTDDEVNKNPATGGRFYEKEKPKEEKA